MSKNTFEENLMKLEKIVKQLEAGEISLEESLIIYKEGMDLLNKCKNKLDTVEKEIEIITQDEKAKTDYSMDK